LGAGPTGIIVAAMTLPRRTPSRPPSTCRRAAWLVLPLAIAACDSGATAPQSDAGPDAPTPTTASFEVEQTITIASTTTGHLAFPDLTRLRDGRLMIVYRQGKSHVDVTGRLMKQFGTADGTSWSAPEILYDAPNVDDRDPSITTLSNGDVLVNYFQYVTLALADGTLAVHHVFVGRSTDDGASFGPFVQVDPGSMSPSNPTLNGAGKWVDGANQELVVHASSSSIIESGGQLVLPAYGGNPLNLANLAATPKSRVSLFVSADGASWTEQPVLTNDATDSWLQEPAILQLASGTTIMQMRTALGSSPSNPGKLMQSTSTDGTAWSSPAPLPFVAHAPELVQLGSGLVLSAYRQLDDAYTHEWVSFSWSLDGAGAWSDPVQVFDCGAVECGYPAIVELDSDHFLLAYYAPGGTAIRAVIYRYTLQ
jgi:hypothetical protein